MLFALIFTSILPVINSRKTFGDVFPHKHKHPVPFPIPGWSPDTNPWDEALYPPFRPELTRRRSKPPQVRLTSDSPAMNGSCLSFTAALEFPPCQKGDASDDCEDARGEVHSGYVFNWTGPDEKGGVFPDGTPLPLSSDWRRRGYVYVWHVMGQYLQTCDGSSSHVTLNTTNMTFGAGVMEVMVYRKRQRRKYSPLSTDTTVFFITDKIPFSVNISQKAVVNSSEQKVFISGSDVVFSVQLHDPSGYLKTADALDYIWDFQDGNHLVTHSSVATHTYSRPANLTVKLLLEASFRVTCPAPATPTTVHASQTHTTAPPTPGATTAALETSKASTSAAPPTTSAAPPTTQSVPPQTSPAAVKRARVQPPDCFRHVYGLFEGQIAVVSPPPVSHAAPANQIVAVSAAQVSNTSVNFMVTCTGSVPSVACTIVAGAACREVQNIICEDVATSDEGCKVSLTRIFQTPGTYCVNITLGVPGGLALATTTSVTVGKRAEHNTPPSSRVSQVVLSSSAVLFAIFALIAIVVYKRNRVYRPVRRCVRGETEKSSWSFHRFRAVLFSSREERSRLLSV